MSDDALPEDAEAFCEFIANTSSHIAAARLRDIFRTALAAERAKALELEMELRKFLWLGHGHQGIYGDDGEMQCAECIPFGVCDHKRDPLDKIRAAVFAIRALAARDQEGR